MEFLKTVIEKLGIDNEMLSKVEAGEMQVDDVVTSYVSQVEKTIEERLGKKIEEQKKTELFGAAYAKTEKQLADEFGVDLSKYETVDKRDRYKTIIKDLKQSQIEMIENLKKEYSSVDAQNLRQLTQQLELSNARLNEKDNDYKKQLIEKDQQFEDFKKNLQIDGIRNKLVEGIKNPRLNPKEMRAVFDAEVREKGFTFEMDADGNIWVNKDNIRVKHPQKATENLKYETLFELVSTENNFTRQSNASEPQKFVFNDDKAKDGLHPARLKYLQERNLI